MYDSRTNEQVSNIIEPMVYVSDNFWEDYCDWERKMVLNMDTEYGEPLPIEILCAQKSSSKTSLMNFFK